MKNIRTIWEHCTNDYSNLPAVRWLDKKDVKEISYLQLDEAVTAIRKGLARLGYSQKHIALIGASSVSWIASYLGVTTGDNVAVPLDVNLPAEDLVDLLVRSDAEALFISPKLAAFIDTVKHACPKIRNIWLLCDDAKDAPCLAQLKAAGSDAVDVEAAEESDLATIIFTSGTTGKSKGVMLSQENLASNVEAVPFTADPGCVLMSVLPIHHAFCLVMDWLKGFSLGAVVCINDSFLHMVRNMNVFKPEVMLMVPLMVESIYKRLAAADPSIPKSLLAQNVFGGNLRIIFTGGAHLDPFYIGKFNEYGVDVLEGYGMSECSPVITSNVPQDHKAGSIGRPLPNVEIKIENDEILVRGSSVMKGYYKMPEETAQTLRDGWLHTGDKGYVDEDGFVFINGRVKNLIILSNGENISPEEIENKIALYPLVSEVIVTGEDNGLTARIYPEKELAQAKGLDDAAVRDSIQNFIDDYNIHQPTYRRITGFVMRDNPFIKNATSKIIRARALEDIPA